MNKILSVLIFVLMILDMSAKKAFAATSTQVQQMQTVLAKYNSPMYPFAKELITIAEKYNLDWTLLAAIAGTESSFGKRMPANCINPYGWGVYGDNKLCFKSFPEAAETVAKGLATRYNTSSLESIGRTYNKVSTQGWINHTQFFVNKIKNSSIPVEVLPIEL